MVVAEMADIQQVTTRSKGKMAKWEAQEAIRKQATEWINKANERNVTEMKEQKNALEEPTETTQPENLGEHHVVSIAGMSNHATLGQLLQLMP